MSHQFEEYLLEKASLIVVASCAAAFCCAPTLATTGHVNPLEGIRAVGIEVMIGGGLTLESSIGLQLLAGDKARAQRLRESVFDAAGETLAEHGIKSFPSADPPAPASGETGWVKVSFYGRPSARGTAQDRDYIFLTILEVWRSQPIPNDGGCDEPMWGRHVLEIASEGALEQRMQEVSVGLLEDLLAAAID